MLKFVFRRAFDQKGLISLLWVAVLISTMFIISIPTYIDWIERMIISETMNSVPPTSKNIMVTTGNLPMIKQAFDEKDQIISTATEIYIDEYVISKNSAIISPEYYWGFENPVKDRTASLLSFVGFNSKDTFLSFGSNESLQAKEGIINAYGPKERLEALGIGVGDIINLDSVKGSGSNDNRSLIESKKNLKNFISLVESQGGSIDDIFSDAEFTNEINDTLVQIREALLSFGITSSAQMEEFLSTEPEESKKYDLNVQIAGYFEEIPDNELFGFYNELFLPSSACLTCQPPIVVVVEENDFFRYLEPLNRGLPVRTWWFLETNENFLLKTGVDHSENLSNFEMDLIVNFPQSVVLTQLDLVIEKAEKQMNFIRAPIFIIFALLIIFSCLILVMFSFLISIKRREEIHYLILRGSTNLLVIKHFFAEWIIYGLPIILLSPILSFLILKFGTAVYLNNQNLSFEGLPINLQGNAFMLSGLTVVSFAVFCFLIFIALNPQLIQKNKLLSSFQRIKIDIFKKYFIDLVLGVSFLLIFLELRMRVLSVESTQQNLSSNIFLLIPLAIVFTLVMFLIRIFPFILKFLGFLGGRLPVLIYLSFQKLSRNSAWYLWLFLIIAIGTTSFVITSSIQESLERSKIEKASFISISDFRIIESSPFGIEYKYIDSLSKIDGVEVVGTANRKSGYLGTTGGGYEAELLVADKNFTDIAWMRDDFFYESREKLFSVFSEPNDQSELIIPDKTFSVEIKNHSDIQLDDSFLWMIVKGSDKKISALSFGSIQPVGETINKSDFKNITPPAKILAIEVYQPSSEDNSVLFELNLESIVFKDEDGDVLMNYGFDNIDDWTAIPSSEGFDTQLEDSENGLKISLGNGSIKGVRGIYFDNNRNGFPAIVSENFLEKTGKTIGEKIIFYSRGTYIPIVIKEKVKYFPGTTQLHGDFLIVSFDQVLGFFELTKLQSFRPNELVVKIDENNHQFISKYINDNFPLSSIKDRISIENLSLVTPVAISSWTGISVIALSTFLVLICLSCAGFYLVNEKFNISENAITESLGISNFNRFVMSYLELGLIIILGIITGFAAGIFISKILNELVMILDQSTKTIFPETLIISWINIILFVSAVFIFYILISFAFLLKRNGKNISPELMKDAQNVI